MHRAYARSTCHVAMARTYGRYGRTKNRLTYRGISRFVTRTRAYGFAEVQR